MVLSPTSQPLLESSYIDRNMTEKALQVVEQKTVIFYEDEITAVVVEEHGRRDVYVPLRPICDYLGVDWSSQRKRITRDPVLSEALMSVVVMTTDIDQESRRPRSSTMACLPLRYLNGWLFGINANRVNEELQEHVIRYQRDCYEVLSEAFQSPTATTSTSSTLLQVREMGLAIVRMAEEQMEFDRRLVKTEGRLDQAAVVVAGMEKRLTAVERKLTSGQVVTDEQVSQVSQAVKAVALTLGKTTGRNEFGAVYGELYRKFGITSYRMLLARRFEEAMRFLTDWHEDLGGKTA
jgi:hypothetical protein